MHIQRWWLLVLVGVGVWLELRAGVGAYGHKDTGAPTCCLFIEHANTKTRASTRAMWLYDYDYDAYARYHNRSELAAWRL